MAGVFCPGFKSEEHRLAFYAARDRYLSSGRAPRCSAKAKHGGPCGALALRGHEQCFHHVATPVRRAQRLRRLARPATAAQAARAQRRAAAALQRIAWKADRWQDGQTVTLGEREPIFQADMRALGFSPSTFSPATADAARWAWIGADAGRMTRDDLRQRVRWNVAKDL